MRILILLITLFSIPAFSFSQYHFMTKNLAELYNRISQYPRDGQTQAINKDSVVIVNIIVENQSIPVCIEKKIDKIHHIGLAVFTDKFRLNQTVIIKFIERKILEYLLTNEDKLPQLMNSEGVTFILNSQPFGSMAFNRFNRILPVLYNFKNYNIMLDGKKYVVLFHTADNDSLIIQFSARMDIISGKDKKELEWELVGKLLSLGEDFQYSNLDTVNVKKQKGSLYVREGKVFFNLFLSHVYFIRKKKTFSYVFNSQYPKQSLANLFLLVLPAGDSIRMEIAYHVYGKVQRLFNVNLNAFNFEMMKTHDVSIYSEESASDSIDVNVLYISKKYDYMHLLYATFPVKKIFSKGFKGLDVHFYSYIRQDNIKNLFPAAQIGRRKKIFLKGIINEQ